MANHERGLRQRTAAVARVLSLPRRTAALLLALAAITLLAASGSGAHNSGINRAPGPPFADYPWLYWREQSSPGDNPPGVWPVSVILGGDVMPGRGVARERDPFGAVSAWLQQADLTVGNLEAVIAPAGQPRPAMRGAGQRILLHAPSRATTWLRDAGFDALALSNNHSLDFGPQGLAATATQLQAAGITPLGAGGGNEAYAPALFTVRGVRLAFLAYNAVPDPDPLPVDASWQVATWNETRAIAAVQTAAQQADVVIVYLHWGQEYAPRPAPWQQETAAKLVEAGAGLVVGHHAHVVQAWQAFPAHNAFAAYSLGNFLFDQSGLDTGQGLALHALFDANGLLGVQALPVWAGTRPRLMTIEEAQPLLARIAPPAPRQAFACTRDGCTIQAQAPLAEESTEGIFWSGSIDLTGDGHPEQVRRAAGRVSILEDGVEVWSSPEPWRVVDVALGDPNDDGRGELLLALWLPDSEGHKRSQPFIVGYRGGIYDVIWGGRPVTAPILEVALGDVTGDRRDDLVVLVQEEDGVGLAVWRWQGWHFSQHWQSAPGAFSDLRLAPTTTEASLLITTGSR